MELPIQTGISGELLQLVGMVQSLIGIRLNVLEDRVNFALEIPGVGRGSRFSGCALIHRCGGSRDRRYSNRGGDATTPKQRSESHLQLFFLPVFRDAAARRPDYPVEAVFRGANVNSSTDSCRVRRTPPGTICRPACRREEEISKISVKAITL